MNEIINAVHALLSVCDGAKAKDESGFNKPDSDFVRSVGAKATHAVVVLPLSIIMRLLNAPEKITWLRAEMMPAHSGACTENAPCEHFNEDTDVLMPSSNGNRHLRFKEFTKLVMIDVITEQWTEE